ncbi:hypothetical protein GO986_07925 [Deinococcus sp. HMF7620]|uniref:Uncharacterized protein n=1 Tax=Deinococcus arboris TaxID=2682977 RepID=A0A7C9HXU6_9DEIO|nr:hypothetical protein [Deinococcus arboris]MVN86690.1 hypothetical protein [Deinococcus arboris]
MQQRAPEVSPVASAPAYTPPQVTALGAWEAVTLVGSVPFNGMPGLPLPGGEYENR